MGLLELSMIGIGLAADAFAVAVGKGLSLRKMSWKAALVVGLYFGFFQALMPYMGYMSGKGIGSIIEKYGGIVAFLLLFFIGANMIREAYSKEDKTGDALDFKSMIVLAIATSIDAFTVGITFSFFKINIWTAVSIIGIVTFILSIIGVKIGNAFGDKYEKSAQIFGGLILIFIGIKSLI